MVVTHNVYILGGTSQPAPDWAISIARLTRGGGGGGYFLPPLPQISKTPGLIYKILMAFNGHGKLIE